MADGDLVTFANVKTYLGYKESMEDLASFLITAVSARVRRLTRRNFSAATYTESLNGHGDNKIILTNLPVLDVTSVCIDTDRVFDAADNLDSDEFYVDEAAGIIELYDQTVPKGLRVVKVVYSAGYTTIPEDLQQAVFEAIDWNYKRFEGGTFGQEQQSAGGVSVRPTLTLPPAAYAVIMSYEVKHV